MNIFSKYFKVYFLKTSVLLGILILCSCSGPKVGRIGDDNVKYEDPHSVETIDTKYGSTDLQDSAEYMTQSLLASQWIQRASSPPKIRLRQVKNYTDEHIDAKGITDKIRIKLLQSGKVRFLADYENFDDLKEERDLTETMSVKTSINPVLDSDYIITGSVRSIRKKNKNIASVYYLITMELVDSESGEILWVDEKEILKVGKKGYIGW